MISTIDNAINHNPNPNGSKSEGESNKKAYRHHLKLIIKLILSNYENC